MSKQSYFSLNPARHGSLILSKSSEPVWDFRPDKAYVKRDFLESVFGVASGRGTRGDLAKIPAGSPIDMLSKSKTSSIKYGTATITGEEFAKWKDRTAVFRSDLLSQRELERIERIRSRQVTDPAELAEGLRSCEEKASLAMAVSEARFLVNNVGSPIDVVAVGFTYPRFNSGFSDGRGGTFGQGHSCWNADRSDLNDQTKQTLREMMRVYLVAVCDSATKQGKPVPFILNRPADFLRGLNDSQKRCVSRCIEQAFAECLQDPSIRVQAEENISEFIALDTNFWNNGILEAAAMGVAPVHICNSDFMQIAGYCWREHKLKCPIPMMRNGGQAPGCSAFADFEYKDKSGTVRYSTPVDEMFSRMTGGTCSATMSSLYNKRAFDQAIVVSSNSVAAGAGRGISAAGAAAGRVAGGGGQGRRGGRVVPLDTAGYSPVVSAGPMPYAAPMSVDTTHHPSSSNGLLRRIGQAVSGLVRSGRGSKDEDKRPSVPAAGAAARRGDGAGESSKRFTSRGDRYSTAVSAGPSGVFGGDDSTNPDPHGVLGRVDGLLSSLADGSYTQWPFVVGDEVPSSGAAMSPTTSVPAAGAAASSPRAIAAPDFDERYVSRTVDAISREREERYHEYFETYSHGAEGIKKHVGQGFDHSIFPSFSTMRPEISVDRKTKEGQEIYRRLARMPRDCEILVSSVQIYLDACEWDLGNCRPAKSHLFSGYPIRIGKLMQSLAGMYHGSRSDPSRADILGLGREDFLGLLNNVVSFAQASKQDNAAGLGDQHYADDFKELVKIQRSLAAEIVTSAPAPMLAAAKPAAGAGAPAKAVAGAPASAPTSNLRREEGLIFNSCHSIDDVNAVLAEVFKNTLRIENDKRVRSGDALIDIPGLIDSFRNRTAPDASHKDLLTKFGRDAARVGVISPSGGNIDFVPATVLALLSSSLASARISIDDINYPKIFAFLEANKGDVVRNLFNQRAASAASSAAPATSSRPRLDDQSSRRPLSRTGNKATSGGSRLV